MKGSELTKKIQQNLSAWLLMNAEAAAVEDKLTKANLGLENYPSRDELDLVIRTNRFWEEEIYSLISKAYPEIKK
jgi:hypothetical protein